MKTGVKVDSIIGISNKKTGLILRSGFGEFIWGFPNCLSLTFIKFIKINLDIKNR
jgi:hypothetical protein